LCKIEESRLSQTCGKIMAGSPAREADR